MEQRFIQTSGATIFVEIMGRGEPVLLLHGFPETHVMWRDISPLLSNEYTVVAADLRGYGDSSCPVADETHGAYSKRAMATDMVEVMHELGFRKFAIAGHDRGARVGYRLALDYPDNVSSITMMDIIPTKEAWDRANKQFALAYWPWILLAQTSPLPEQFILSHPEAIVTSATTEWGTSPAVFSEVTKSAYTLQLSSSDHVHAICEEYRAAATVDYMHDHNDIENGTKIKCPVQVLWAQGGPLDKWYDKAGGPLHIWKKWAASVEGQAVPGGHFFPEENPALVTNLLSAFLRNSLNANHR